MEDVIHILEQCIIAKDVEKNLGLILQKKRNLDFLTINLQTTVNTYTHFPTGEEIL